MENVLENLKLLQKDMKNKGWCIEAFDFTLKEQHYVVLVKLYSGKKPDEYALAELEFIRIKDDERLITHANSRSIGKQTQQIREFFGIEYSENLKDAMTWLSGEINKAIPITAGLVKNTQLQIRMVESLSNSDGESVNAIYCIRVRRNGLSKYGVQGQRSDFNDNKTRCLRPNLYKAFEQDKTISFCYTDDKSKELSDTKIQQNFAQQK